jgi:hypothetical protein
VTGGPVAARAALTRGRPGRRCAHAGRPAARKRPGPLVEPGGYRRDQRVAEVDEVRAGVGVHDDHVGTFTDLQALADPEPVPAGQRAADRGELGVMVDAGVLVGASTAAVPADGQRAHVLVDELGAGAF